MKTVLIGVVALVVMLVMTGGHEATAAGPAPVGLGTAASFAVLAGTPAVTNTGPTTITGDLGIHPAVAVTGFPPGTLNGTMHAADAVALQAKSDLATAYLDAAGRTPATTVAGGTLGGKTLVGGVYNAGGATLGLSGTLTLDGQNDPNSVWVFQATSDLVTASSSTVTFVNGAQPCNVFWQVTSSATLGSGSSFVGTILALTSITLASGVTVNGRLLARNGTVTLINDAITKSTCVVAAVEREIPDTTPKPTATPSPAATPSPSATPRPATSTPAVAPTIAQTAAPAATTLTATATATTPAIGVTGTVFAPATAAPQAATILSLPSTATAEDDLPLLFLAIPVVALVVLYLIGRARRRRALSLN